MFDVIIIGAGIVGTAIARNLSQYALKVLVLEKNTDVASETTMANSAIIHSGYDPKPGTNKARFNVMGAKLYPQICKELNVHYDQVGSLTVAVDEADMKTLDTLKQYGDANGVPVEIISKERALEMEPNLSKDIYGALYAPTTAIVYPMEIAIGMMENAMDNGVQLELNQKVVAIDRRGEGFKVITESESFLGKVVVNAAGLFSDQIHNMVLEPSFLITPRRGQYYVLDKSQKGFVNRVIYPCPTEKGKGVLLVPTIHGNILIGPTSEKIEEHEVKEVTREGLEMVRNSAAGLSDTIPYHQVIHTFSGLRPTGSSHDFIIQDYEKLPGFIDVGGIESPGLASAPGIALAVVDLIRKQVPLKEKANFNPIRRGYGYFAELDLAGKRALIETDSSYGHMVCRCEGVTEAEIVDSIRRNAGAKTVKGVKIRVRPGMGRCQGGFCEPQVIELLARELGIDPTAVLYDKEGSNVLIGETKSNTWEVQS